MKLRGKIISLGKTDRRNDDMALAVPLFSYQWLGVVGDFTSDSPKGVNEACARHLGEFVKERLTTWREMLLPASRLLPLLAQHTNDWLVDYGAKAQTTLIVFSWNLNTETCHYLSVGDSGLAVVGTKGVRYLKEGDRNGLRISAGFLPGQLETTVHIAKVEKHETLFAFSDGLWENTTNFMSDSLLATAMSGESLEQVEASLHHHILQRAIRKDDLSVLLMKGENMAQSTKPPSGELDPRLRDEIQRQVHAAVGSGGGSEVTPLERDLVRLMNDAPGLEDHFLKSLLPPLCDQMEERFDRLLKDRLNQTEEEMRREMVEQQQKYERRLSEQKQQIQKLERKLKNLDLNEPVQARSKASPTRSAHSAGWSAILDLDQSRNQWLLGIGIALVVVLLGFGMKHAFWPTKSMEVPVDDPVEEVQSTQQQVPEEIEPVQQQDVSAPKNTVDYEPAPVSDSLLKLLDVDRDTYIRHTNDIQNALDQMPEITLPGTEHVNLENSEDLNQGILSLTLGGTDTWIQQRPVAREKVAKIWLQSILGMSRVDGQPGKGTREKFVQRFGAEEGTVFDEAVAGWKEPS